MKNEKEIIDALNSSKRSLKEYFKAATEPEVAEDIRALLSEAIEAAASDDRDRLVSITEQIKPLNPVGLDLTTRVKQLLETDAEEDSE